MRKFLGAAVFIAGAALGGFNETLSARKHSFTSYIVLLFLAFAICGGGVALWKSSDPASDGPSDEAGR